MKKENKTAIIGGIVGFTSRVTSMFVVGNDKGLNNRIKNIKTEKEIREKINK